MPVIDSPPQTASSKSLLIPFYALYLALIALPYVFFMVILTYGVPHFREIFKDFKVILPTLTEQLLSLSVLLESPLIWIPLLLILLALPYPLAALQNRFKTATQQVTFFMIVTLLVLFLSFTSMMLIQVALFLPLVKLVQSVSGEGGGGM